MLNRIIIILLIITAAMGYSLYQKRSLHDDLKLPDREILSKLPDASFETLDGKEFLLDTLYSERIELLVVHYWGTWCGPCEAELPELLSFIKQFEGRTGVRFILVAVNDDKIKVLKHLKSLSYVPSSVMWLMDNKNIHRNIYGTTRVPETYVFSSDKATLRKFVGPQKWSKSLYFQTFDELIKISTSKL